jgi:phage/plasmid-like protein (TIGR03299 family)
MSRETHEWLSNNVLIGFTEKRGNAWHYREGDQNHYEGPVPVQDVLKRLFAWKPEERPLYIPTNPDAEFGVTQVPDRKAIVRSDNGHVLGIFGEGYQAHPYDEWLVTNVSNILGELHVASAGLLKGGAVAWVQAEMPDNLTTVDGVQFRPFFNAFSSLDGSFASTYKTGITNVVCDNTMRAAQNEDTAHVKIKSTRNSKARVIEIREALGLVHAAADAFSEEAHKLCAMDFTDRQFEQLVEQFNPRPPADASPRAITMAESKRDAYWTMWRTDDRVAPWNGTAWGAYQAFNTYGQHVQSVKGAATRAERNMLNTLNGKNEKADAKTLDAIFALA